MAKSSVFFTLLCLWSSTAVFGREIPTEENDTPLQTDESLASVCQNWAAHNENLEKDHKDLIKTNLELRREISAQNETLEKLTRVLSFVQNELESEAEENETGISEKKLKSIRREFEELKLNGSIISSFPNSIAQTTTCGGFITVKKEHEVRYEVPSLENRNESGPKFCIWIVKNSQSQNLVLELKNAERGQDFQLWTMHSFIPEIGSTSQELHVVGARNSIPESYFALYFRLNSSTNNSNKTISFNLNIKSNISDPLRNRQRRSLVKRVQHRVGSSLQSFSYPLPPSTLYSADERTFIILKPIKSGSRIWLKMKSVNTEPGADFIDIVTFSGRPNFRFRLTGDMTTEREFISGTDEPMIVFFGSDSSVQGSGFSFDYAEERGRSPTTQNQNVCGGFVPMDFEGEISYQVPSNASSSVCIWVVSNELGRGIQVQLANQNRWTNHESTELFIIHSIEENSSKKTLINIQDPSVNFSSEASSYFLLYFRFNPDLQKQKQNNPSPQGFRLRLQANFKVSTANVLKISHTELTPSSTPTEQKEFSYPVESLQYQNEERAFIIIKPTSFGRNIVINMTAIDTEWERDTVQIMSYSEEKRKMTFDFSFSGTFYETSPRTLIGRENEPVIVFFSSDYSATNSGFQFTYWEECRNTISEVFSAVT